MFQIKPVRARYVFDVPIDPHLAAFHYVNQLWRLFEPYELVHNHRQGEGSKWVETLNRIRKNEFTKNDIEVLRSRIVPMESLDRDAFHIAYKNETVSTFNRKALNEINGQSVVFTATKIPSKNYKVDSKKGTIDRTAFVNKLELKIGARVKLIFNVNTIDELVNGSFGTVVAFERKNPHSEIYAIIVKFDQETVGVKHRQEHKVLADKYAQQNGTPIFKKTFEYLRPGLSRRAKIIQFPLNLAHSSTAHSTQVKNYFTNATSILSYIKDQFHISGNNNKRRFSGSTPLEKK